jgi:uncharacterized membrane protein
MRLIRLLVARNRLAQLDYLACLRLLRFAGFITLMAFRIDSSAGVHAVALAVIVAGTSND